MWERFLGSARRECLDHLLICGERQVYRVIKDYVGYFNRARPHQGLEQSIPEGSRLAYRYWRAWHIKQSEASLSSVKMLWSGFLAGTLGAPPMPAAWHTKHWFRPAWFAGVLGGVSTALGVAAALGAVVGIGVGVTADAAPCPVA